jgi:hypothetical protein
VTSHCRVLCPPVSNPVVAAGYLPRRCDPSGASVAGFGGGDHLELESASDIQKWTTCPLRPLDRGGPTGWRVAEDPPAGLQERVLAEIHRTRSSAQSGARRSGAPRQCGGSSVGAVGVGLALADCVGVALHEAGGSKDRAALGRHGDARPGSYFALCRETVEKCCGKTPLRDTAWQLDSNPAGAYRPVSTSVVDITLSLKFRLMVLRIRRLDGQSRSGRRSR